MTLTATQRAALDAALARPDRRLEPLPAGLKGGAARKVVDALVARGLAEAGPDGAPVATEAAVEALGGRQAGEMDLVAPEAATRDAAPEAGSTTAPKLRAGTKQARMIELLRRPEGAAVTEIMAETGWLAHTVRGAMAGALKKRLGLDIRSEPVEGRGRTYRIAD